MEPRILMRTHYQVDEPAYMRALIQKCSSPVRSEYKERIASRLHAEVKTYHSSFNLPASNYAVDLAKGLGLLNSNHVWTDVGHLLNIVAQPVENGLNLNLSFEERLFFFRAFLVSDGAALVFFAEKSKANDLLPPVGQNWVDVANDLAKSVFRAYLEIATDLPSRAKIRQTLQARDRNPYKGKSGPHQSLVHVHALFRMGLIAKENGTHSRQYNFDVTKGTDSRPLVRLANVVPNVEELERVIGAHDWANAARTVFLPDVKEHADESQTPRPALLNQVRSIYDQVIGTGVNLCPLTTLIEAIQIKMLASQHFPITYSAVMEILKKAQGDYPKDVRFHVDRYGRPAFLKLGDGFRP